MVLPEDIQAVGIPVMAHRIEHTLEGSTGTETAAALLEETAVP